MENFLEINNDTFKAILVNGDLRKLKVGGSEVIQRIYFAVRDEQWLNVPYNIRNFNRQTIGERITCSYEMFFNKREIQFIAAIKFSMAPGSIVIESSSRALTGFKKNRIGFCLHLPVTLKGKGCTVTHTDHTTTTSVFPLLISPHQPFKNIKSIEWINANHKIKIEFEGDIFEMEDQRNWTDASYKIYSTPLNLPFPVDAAEGANFYQKVSINISGTKSVLHENLDQGERTSSNDIAPCPQFGIMEVGQVPLDGRSIQGDFLLPFSHYRIDFRLYKKDWEKDCSKSINRAIFLKLPVYAVIYFNQNFLNQANEFVNYISTLKAVNIHTICLLSYEAFVLADDALKKLYTFFRQRFTNVLIGAGTDANFAQLNRNRPVYSHLDFLCYTIQPQEHASDVLSITENIQGQADTVYTAQTFGDDKAVHISALSFYKRFNANLNYIPDKEISEYEYKGSDFEAAWFIASLHQLITAGAACINIVYPVKKELPLIQFFNYMAGNRPEYFYTCGSSFPEKYALLSWQSKDKRHSVFANLTAGKAKIVHPYAKIVLEPFEIYYTNSVINNENKFYHI